MRAAYVERLGPADEIHIGEFPTPQAAPGHVLARVTASVVNPVDTHIRAGRYSTPVPLPFIIGRDLVGEVVQVGAGVTRFAPGQRIWCNSLGYDGRQGAFAEYVTIPEERVYPLPASVDSTQAVAVFHPAATAFLGLVTRMGGLHPGQTVLVGGGAGNVGAAVAQLAAAMGARVLATAHGAEDIAWCRACGAAEVFDYADPDLATAIRAVAPDGADVVWNTSGHDDLDFEVDLLAHGGRLALTAGLDQRPSFPIGPFYTRNARAVGFTISAATVTELAEAAAAINALLAAGRLRMRIARTLPLADARLAHQLVEGNRADSQAGEKIKGRVVVVMQP
ncbi:MAG: NADPH:quinone reductase [Chloroflexota bacterium]|nr:NADPH:quinone reductase [Chloroflexota bacterium]